jgi:urease accessory protein
MSRLFRAVLAVAFLSRADPALAHLPIEGVGGFYGGLLHPILVPTHALSVVALGLFIGRQRQRRMASLVFAAALVAGLMAIALAVDVPVVSVMLANTTLLGVLVAAAWAPPQPLGWLLAAIAGATLALDSPPQAVTIAEANVMLVGTALGACLAVAVVGAIASYLTKAWQQIAVRVLASWIAASAILVLAMSWR